jgi:hypothetical protein
MLLSDLHEELGHLLSESGDRDIACWDADRGMRLEIRSPVLPGDPEGGVFDPVLLTVREYRAPSTTHSEKEDRQR